MTATTHNGFTAGIPSQMAEDPWTEDVEAGQPLDEMIAAEAVDRLFGPHDQIHGQLFRLVSEAIDAGLEGPARDQAHDALHALDCLRWGELHLAIEISVRVLRHLPAPTMGLEAMLQTALAGAGLGTVAAADELTRQVYAGGTRRAMQRVWPEFDPTVLTIMRPDDGRGPYGLAAANADAPPRTANP